MAKRTSDSTRPRKRRSPKPQIVVAAEQQTEDNEVRRTTVHGIMQPRVSGEIHVPCIRIVGKWLLALGFGHGDRLTIETRPGELRILKASSPEG